ncbi:ABC transporter substrate-binding protein [Nostoc sp. UHCC 0870]|uniref:ABC transporter substrate-binding protein n=1 Tax=Nostoc sp. UHCC 0870 TaxID=2914041 RepID=UPI001EDFB608|nr:ABC transporter substrate-binding protein [Nostoc sp. UHCC 0870]UKO96891.1 ABC transporter substrate-binding protein [Nostoc sp. UHCC 0870]
MEAKEKNRKLIELGEFESPVTNIDGLLSQSPTPTNPPMNQEEIVTITGVNRTLLRIPTALGKWEGLTRSWREHFNFVAEALGKQEAAQQAWNRYYQRIKELKIALNDRYVDKEISIIGVYGGMRIYSDGQDSFASSILNDIGLQRIRNANSPLPISEEKLEEVDSDIIFVMIFQDKGEESRKAFEKLQQKPLWQTLRAVQKGQIYLVDREAWIGANLIAADVVIDDLYKYLVNTP